MMKANGIKPTVLLVDDKKENLFALETLLEELDLNIVKTTSGYDALKIALNQEIATVLLDVQMPEIDGYEVARMLKENNKTRSIPVIFVTAINQEPEHVVIGYESGAVDYLFKPLNASVTRAKVNAFIRLYLQKKELEEKNEQLENLNLLVQNSMDLMCIMEGSSIEIQASNPAWQKYLGYSYAELNNAPFFKFLSSDTDHLKKKLGETILAEEKQFDWESQMLKKAGERVWFDWNFVFKNGKWYGSGRNITDKKNAEHALSKAYEELEEKVNQRTKDLVYANSQLLKANKDLDQFVYTASHDLKLPIANLEGLHLALSSELSEKGEEVPDIIDMFGSCIMQVKETIHDLISIIHKKDQKNNEVLHAEDCKTILEEIKMSIQEIISSNDARIEATLNECDIRFPKANFKSILYNLLTNAIKYRSPERAPHICVTFTDDQDYKVLSVRDNGVGISEEGVMNLFEKFKRLHNQEDVEGTGIGLYIVKSNIEKHGGKIEVESTVGEGSEFRIFFPKE